ncbi:AIPR family protein [Candidatus Omnitrophota bacterium]
MSIKMLIEKTAKNFIKNYPDFQKEGENKKFLFFSMHHLLKYANITYEGMLDNIIDGTNDYGIDGIFVFSSGELLADDDDLEDKIGLEDKIKILIVQVSRDAGFGETALLKLKNGIEEIFDLETMPKGNEDYKRKATLIRNVWEHCFRMGSANSIEIELAYITLSTDEKVNSKTQGIEKKLLSFLKKEGLSRTKIKYIGIPSLYKYITESNYDGVLTFKEVNAYSESYNKKVAGFYGLVKVKDFLKLIVNVDNELEEKYFEGNIRDYYGVVKKVNLKIKETVNSPNRMNLWCLNNGLTIICDRCNQRGKTIKLSNFHIVNGCQTAHVLYECMDQLKDDEIADIIVKIIETKDPEIFDSVIEATNSQTSVPPALLHANELIQRSIEDHFLKYTTFPLYYERRMNYYKRRHKPKSRIVTMIKLFQVVYSIFEKKPSAARGRPSESFERGYNSVFDATIDYDAYLFSYMLYLRMNNINREEMVREVGKDLALFVVRRYGIFHILRVALSLMIKSDKKINLKDKKNVFTQSKRKLFSLLENKTALDECYRDSVIVLQKSIVNLRKKDKEALINYNMMKNEDLDRYIGRMITKGIASSQ